MLHNSTGSAGMTADLEQSTQQDVSFWKYFLVLLTTSFKYVVSRYCDTNKACDEDCI